MYALGFRSLRFARYLSLWSNPLASRSTRALAPIRTTFVTVRPGAGGPKRVTVLSYAAVAIPDGGKFAARSLLLDR